MTDSTSARSTPLFWHPSAQKDYGEHRAGLQSLVANQSSLHRVAKWAASAGHALIDCVDQDEYNRDLIIRHSAHGAYLVYDCS